MWEKILVLLALMGPLVACSNFISEPPRLLESAPSDIAWSQTTPSPLPTIDPPVTVTPSPTPFPTLVLPSLTPYPNDHHFSIGTSWEGRAIWAWQFGDGPDKIVLVGGIHGGYEGNTVVLSELLVNHFRQNPEEVLPGIKLVIIPVANPDGLPRGGGLEGRFNARGVDLNRNWGCEWAEMAYLRDMEVDPGPRPFSEPEALALRTYFMAEPPDAVVFYHSAADGIFMGSCGEHERAAWMGHLLEDATGYPYGPFRYYEITGDASNWLAERDIPAAVVELSSRDDPEFARNLAGVLALQCYFVLKDTPYSDIINHPNPIVRRLCRAQ